MQITEKHHKDPESQAATASNESLNHPENIHIVSVFFFLDAKRESQLQQENKHKL